VVSVEREMYLRRKICVCVRVRERERERERVCVWFQLREKCD